MKDIKRPFQTLYPNGHKGAASTEKGAIRATVVRVFMSEHDSAEIIDRRTGVVLYTIRKHPTQGIAVNFGRSGGNARHLRRVS